MFLVTVLQASSQEDSIKVPAKSARRAFMMQDSLSIMKRERDSLYVLKSRCEKLSILDSVVIGNYGGFIALKDKEVADKQHAIDNITKQNDNFSLLNTQLTGIIKKKNKTIGKIVVGGVTITGILTYLLIKK